MKIDRLFSIVNILINNKNVTAPYLAEKFNVSVRTIYRDIDTLSENGIPVYSTQGKGGGIFLMDGYSVDKTLLSDDEQKEVLSALYGMGATGKVSISESLSKLKSLFKKDVTDWIEIDFHTWQQSEKDQEYFDIIKSCIINCRLLSFEYFSNKGEKTKRVVEPYRLIFKGYAWYVYAYCRKRKDFRIFKLCRIDNLNVVEGKFESKRPEKINFKYDYDSNEEYVKVKMKIDMSMSSKVYDDFRDESIEIKDGKFIVTAKMRNDSWLYNYFFTYGDEIEVLEPLEIREGLKKRISKILKKYS